MDRGDPVVLFFDILLLQEHIERNHIFTKKQWTRICDHLQTEAVLLNNFVCQQSQHGRHGLTVLFEVNTSLY